MKRSARAALAALGLLLGMAAARAESPEPLPLTEIAPGVLVHEAPVALAAPANGGGIANLGIVIGRDAVAVIDTGGSLLVGRRLLAAVRARTALPVRYVINTHVHPDHVLGNAAFEGAEVVGHPALPEALRARAERYVDANRALVGPAFAGTRIVPPTRLVDAALTLDLGGRRLLVEAWPTAHTNSDVTVLDEATGTWFLGDLLFLRHVPALDGRLQGWLDTLARLKERPAARAVPGHGPASVPWPAAAEPVTRYLERLRDDVRAGIRKGDTLRDTAAAAGRGEEGRWMLFHEFNPRNATAAYQELEWE
jgi:quinoprotein relay system zinc metallohydrolase 2